MAERTIFWLLIAVVVLSPLPLGSHRPWAWSLVGAAVGALLVAWAVALHLGRAQIAVPARKLAWPAAAFTLVFVWAGVQAFVPIPLDWAHPLWAEAQRALGQPVSPRISLDASLTSAALFRLAAYVGVFWLATQLGRDRARARAAIIALVLAGMAYALYGLSMHFLGIERILWLEKWAYVGDLTATFVNRNAYGAYAGLGMVCTTGMLLHAARHRHRPQQVYDWAQGTLVRMILFAAATLVLATALLLTHSRGAFLSTALAIVALVIQAIVARLIRGKGAILAVMLGCGLAATVGLVGDGTAQRLWETTELSPDEARPHLYRKTLEAIADSPWTGSGLGAFLPTHRMYRDHNLSAALVWDFAHNIYLESALDLGIPGAALLFLSITMVVCLCIRGLRRRRRDHVYPALAVAAAILVGGHGLVDFSAQMPAIAVTFAFLLGIGTAQSWPSADLPHRGTGRTETAE